MILCDIGAKKYNICSDITTTFPVNGKFTKFQKDIYDVVLDAQLAAIASVKSGVVFKDVSQISTEKLVEGLTKLGILRGDHAELMSNHVIGTFMPHSLGHYLGKWRANGRTRHSRRGTPSLRGLVGALSKAH